MFKPPLLPHLKCFAPFNTEPHIKLLPILAFLTILIGSKPFFHVQHNSVVSVGAARLVVRAEYDFYNFILPQTEVKQTYFGL